MTEQAGAEESSIGAIQDFVLSRELAEIYLLLDNISSTKGKTIPSTIDDPIFKTAEGEPAKTWLEQVCEIAWPPDGGSAQYDALNAARLIRVKDALNEEAAPATGASIAFTLLMSSEVRDRQPFTWRSFWPFAKTPDEPPPPTPPSAYAKHRHPPSRASLAVLAYPSYARKTPRYRAYLALLVALLMAWLVITCLLSWDVATGSSLLNRANGIVAAKANAATVSPTDPKPPGTTTATNQPPVQAPSGSTAAPPVQPTQTRPLTPAAVTTTPVTDQPAASAPLTVTTSNLEQWLDATDDLWLRKQLRSAMGGGREKSLIAPPAMPSGSLDQASATPLGPNVEWATVFIGVLAGSVLPIFYGLLGAGAAVVRVVSGKMRDSTLMPRDIALAYVRLCLGAVIGACVGLFANSDGNAAQSSGGLLGAVHLSASALCFVAGFGVEGVFVALESLMTRLFNIVPSAQSGTA